MAGLQIDIYEYLALSGLCITDHGKIPN